MIEKTTDEIMALNHFDALDYMADLMKDRNEVLQRYSDLQDKFISLQVDHLKLMQEHIDLKKMVIQC